jgi:hypothetical protein
MATGFLVDESFKVHISKNIQHGARIPKFSRVLNFGLVWCDIDQEMILRHSRWYLPCILCTGLILV